MRALFLRQKEKHRIEWYKSHGIKPPELSPPKTARRKYIANTQTLTNTVVVEHFSKDFEPKSLEVSYWEGEGAGIEPLEFRESMNILRSDLVVSRKSLPVFKPGELNQCFTPYENDLLTFNTFEATRRELKRRADQLAFEMDRVDQEFNRNPVDKWFCIKNKQFTTEHCRYLEKQRRRAAKVQFKDFYEAEEKKEKEGQ